jgi:hypothetical protein
MDQQTDRTATGNPLWHEHLERMRALRARPTSSRTSTRRAVGSGAEEARGGEWTATPPGRLGRRLLAEIEPYLEFFALARAS